MPSSQLIFDIPFKSHYKPQDFIASASNQEAFDYISAWPKWVDMGVFIFGPASCGKTHLCHVWRNKSQATFIKAKDLGQIKPFDMPSAIIVEDIQDITPEGAENLFHLYNHLSQNKGSLVVTSDCPLSDLNIGLKDLRSRLSRLVTVQMKTPDQDLMRFYIMKLFSDLQVTVSENEIKYLAAHLNRDFKEVTLAIKQVNDKSIAEKRKITIPFIKTVLAG